MECANQQTGDWRIATKRKTQALPREGPGDDATTLRALQSVAPYLPDTPIVLDIGCGPRAQTLVLARNTSGSITAVEVERRFETLGYVFYAMRKI